GRHAASGPAECGFRGSRAFERGFVEPAPQLRRRAQILVVLGETLHRRARRGQLVNQELDVLVDSFTVKTVVRGMALPPAVAGLNGLKVDRHKSAQLCAGAL